MLAKRREEEEEEYLGWSQDGCMVNRGKACTHALAGRESIYPEALVSSLGYAVATDGTRDPWRQARSSDAVVLVLQALRVGRASCSHGGVEVAARPAVCQYGDVVYWIINLLIGYSPSVTAATVFPEDTGQSAGGLGVGLGWVGTVKLKKTF